MTFTLAYLLAVVPVLAVVAAAVWPPRPGPIALIVAGPLITLAAVLGIRPFDSLGWLASIGVPYALLTVAPAVPWRRPWARVAVPGTVLAVCAGFAVLAEGEPAVLFYAALPVIVALSALAVALLSRRRTPVA